MSITATELKSNLGKYLDQAATEDIYISKNGKIIAKITSPYKNKLDIVKELYGSIPNTVTLEDAQKRKAQKFMKVLIDTCVVVDFLQQRQPFAESALKVFMLAGSGEINGYITAKSVTDIYYLIHRITHSDSVTRETLEKLFSIVEILDTTSNDICLALSSTISDYEDAVMIETGIREKMDCIVTRNLKDYKKAKFTVYSPEEFCSITSQ